jgi:hypothetical protein
MILIAVALVFAGCTREISGNVAQSGSTSDNCFECHGDKDVFLQVAQAQFVHSAHPSGDNTDRNRINQSFYQACEKCHTHEGFVEEWAGITATGTDFTALKCFTCHTPHSEGDFSLRVNQAITLANSESYNRGTSNICVACHQSRANVNTAVVDSVKMSSRFGPHYSNQGDMLIGTNAYEYAGVDYLGSWHATGATDGCIPCHQAASGHETIGGHSWNMRNEDRDFELITGCNIEGCHLSNPLDSINRIARADYDNNGQIEGVQTELAGMIDTLGALLFAAGLVDSTGTPIDDLVVPDADSAGAVFNYVFVQEDQSLGIHNTAYAVKLLQSAIDYIKTGDPTGGSAPRYGPGLVRAH